MCINLAANLGAHWRCTQNTEKSLYRHFLTGGGIYSTESDVHIQTYLVKHRLLSKHFVTQIQLPCVQSLSQRTCSAEDIQNLYSVLKPRINACFVIGGMQRLNHL